MNKESFIPGEISIDPMDQLDNDLIDDSQLETEEIDLNETNEDDALDDSDNSIDDQQIDQDDTSPEDKQDKEDSDDDSFDDYSEAALAVKLIEESGLQIYNELNKDLTFEDLARDVPEYITQAVEARIEERLEELGEYADYIKLLDSGVPKESIQPAIEIQRIASFDLKNPEVTEDHLFDLVKTMYLRKGLADTEATALAEVSKNSKRLEEDAEKSIEFHSEYINGIKQKALQEYQYNQQRDKERQEQEYQKFLGVIQGSKIGGIEVNKKEQKIIHDAVYNKNQLIKYTNEHGQEAEAFVSKYELGLYQASQNPEKMAIIAYLIANDFNLNSFKNIAEASVSRSILNKLENKSTSKRNNNNNRNNQDFQTNKKTTSPYPVQEFNIF